MLEIERNIKKLFLEVLKFSKISLEIKITRFQEYYGPFLRNTATSWEKRPGDEVGNTNLIRLHSVLFYHYLFFSCGLPVNYRL